MAVIINQKKIPCLVRIILGARDIVKVKSIGEDPRATGGLVSNPPRPRANETKQHVPW